MIWSRTNRNMFIAELPTMTKFFIVLVPGTLTEFDVEGHYSSFLNLYDRATFQCLHRHARVNLSFKEISFCSAA